MNERIGFLVYQSCGNRGIGGRCGGIGREWACASGGGGWRWCVL